MLLAVLSTTACSHHQYVFSPIHSVVVNQVMKLMHYSTHYHNISSTKCMFQECCRSWTNSFYASFSLTNISRCASSIVIALFALFYISAVKRSIIGNVKSTPSMVNQLGWWIYQLLLGSFSMFSTQLSFCKCWNKTFGRIQ